MKDKLQEIIDKIQEVKNNTGEGIMTFLCLVVLCVICFFAKEIKEEQHQTNKSLGVIINILERDSSMDAHESDEEEEDEEPKNKSNQKNKK